MTRIGWDDKNRVGEHRGPGRACGRLLGASAQGGAQPAPAGLTLSAAQGSAERSITAEASAPGMPARAQLVTNKRTTYMRQPRHS